ncbi:MAG: hypothetical protein PSX71_02715 [bacterium]|nr:hypothetical protein [bacterium]
MPGVVELHLLRVEAISRGVLVGYALALLFLSGVDVVLLKMVVVAAKQSQSLLDDVLFLSASSMAFYLLPLVSAGIGVNLLSFSITQHLRVSP